MTDQRPSWTKWSRKAGGVKICPKRGCRHRHPAVMRINGKVGRPKVCIKCGADLPEKLTYPRKGRRTWYVREFDPATGRQRDFACESSEQADELIREKQRDFTRDPVQVKLLEKASVLIREVQADDLDAAVNTLIVALGGDATGRTIRGIPLAEFRQTVCAELRTTEDLSESYATEAGRVLDDFATITGVSSTADIDEDAIRKFRHTLKAGGWRRGSREVKPLGNHTVKGALAALRAVLTRGVDRRWVNPKVVKAGKLWSHKVEKVSHLRMPDDALAAILKATPDRWWRAFTLLAYNGACRRDDVLRLQWSDVDLDGSQADRFDMPPGCPSVRIENHKGKDPRRLPLHPATVKALQDLRNHPTALTRRNYPTRTATISEHVFPVLGYARAASEVSTRFARIVVNAGLVDAKGSNLYSLHDLRRKANDDTGRAGGSLRDQMAITGHKSVAVNVNHYQTESAERLRELMESNPCWERIA